MSGKNELGLAIRLARIAAGLSQWQLAAKADTHPTTINLIERGKIEPSARIIERAFAELELSAPRTSALAALVLRETRRIVEKYAATQETR